MKNETIEESLIVFTRYPEAGKTKTRMIPILGAEGAAQLQRQMTEHTLREVQKLQSDRPLSVEVHFTGSSEQLMKDWLGWDLVYRHQSEGDLGQRMRSAFELSFNAGMSGVVIIGIDCPDLNRSKMREAYKAIGRDCDLVLGPAADGGYYLIGLSRLVPELFVGINWGTSEVLAQTKAIAEKLGLKVHYLSVLNDVDRPEDLEIWQRYQKNI